MFGHQQRIAASQGRELWPLLSLLLLAVILPTVCLLWFMTQASRNERMAVRQKLTELYEAELVGAQIVLTEHWAGRAASLERYPHTSPAQRFAALVADDVADSVVIFDRQGEPVYPALAVGKSLEIAWPPKWAEAEALEYESGDLATAAEYYARICSHALDVNVAAAALQAQVRCLVKAGEIDAALEIVSGDLAKEKYGSAVDAKGRRIVPAVQAYILAVSGVDDPLPAPVVGALVRSVANYGQPMPSAQRVLLMKQLESVNSDWPMLDAEELALTYLGEDVSAPESSVLSAVASTDLWQMASPDRGVIGLYSGDRVVVESESVLAEQVRAPGATVALVRASKREAFLVAPAGNALPNWELMVELEGDNPFATAAEKQVAVYLWTAFLVVFVIVILGAFVARHLLQQARLNRMKNDFVATVSHELKTPLASMRVFVDTLLDGKIEDQKTAREYLELVSRENARLSRLIDNFLTFSRMERNKRSFEFCDVDAAEVVQGATDALGDRYEKPGCSLSVQVDEGLPMVVADRDSLVTVLVNLLDNAWKYTGDEKVVTLHASQDGDGVRFAVRDNGVGLSRRDAKRVLERFYQVDRSLARKAEGCGLGLSIVKFILDAHNGKLEIDSSPGEGSTFSVWIPSDEGNGA